MGAMLRYYLMITIRNLRRHKTYSILNITGLAIGIACCILVLLYVQDELSYDRYHTKASQIYRIALTSRATGNLSEMASTPALLGPAV